MANLGDISKINLPNGDVVSIKDKIARESLVPAVGSSDNGKVLTASYSNNEGSYSWQPASGGGTSDVIQGYYYNNKFYEDSSHTIEIQGEVDKLYADIGSATDGWDLYMWANKAGNNAFTSIYDRLYKEGIVYGTCDTGSSTAAKTVSITGFKLQTGSIVTVKFTNALSLSSAKTLNVNDTGAKTITYNNSSTWSYQFAAGSTITFMYDGLNYVIASASPGVQSASSGGTTITEVTTGDKYSWNNKQSALSTSQLAAVNSGVKSSTVSQVATNASNISWTKTTLQFSATAANTYEYTGLSVSCPANTLLEIWAIDDNSNSRITAIAVTDNKTSINTVGAVIGENAEPLTMDAGAQWAREVHCVTPRLYNSVHTYYVWVKRGSTGANNVTLLTRKIVTQ